VERILQYVVDTARKPIGVGPPETLTGWEIALQNVLRLAGPALLGLGR
jgi:hypothetical protein